MSNVLNIAPENSGLDSCIMFVRSQSQLALDNPAAKGQRLTHSQVLRAFGEDVVKKVLEDGVVSLVPSYHEPARTLKNKREQLGFDLKDVAKFAHLDLQRIIDAETPGEIVPIQELNEICQVLALDESVLGFRPSSGGDDKLGVRLRMLTEDRDTKSFSVATVEKLVEAAWVIAKQASLSEALNREMHYLTGPKRRPDTNYSYPTFEKGYLLAERTRKLLDLDDESPIESVRVLVEEVLNIPLIQTELDVRFAGATIANGAYRGIVINENGRNSDVAVRRMTTCHELAHLLWDSDEKLNRLLVDEYESIEGHVAPTDVVEMRANSFAVAFLAPRTGVLNIVNEAASTKCAIERVAERYGISISAARHHIRNVCKIETNAVSVSSVNFGTWIGVENRTIDFIPGLDNNVPISRRGMFTGIVAKAYLESHISEDTANMFLKSKVKITPEVARTIADLWKIPS